MSRSHSKTEACDFDYAKMELELKQIKLSRK